MRTRTLRKIGLIVVLIALGLMLVGCNFVDQAYFAGPEGIQISVYGGSSPESTHLVIKVGDYTKDTNARYVYWYYDVPEGKSEYVIVYFDLDNNTEADTMVLHLLTNKKPPEQK